jgi:signal transduction histidine kinase
VPSVPLHTWVEPWLVALSLFTAAVWSFAAIELAGRLRLVTHPAVRCRWLAAAAAALGCGVWGTQISGILAIRVPADVHYSLWLVAASLIPAAAGCACALAVAMPTRRGRRTAAVASLGFGISVAVANGAGLAAIRADGATRSWSIALMLVSFVPAAVAGRYGMHLAFDGLGAARSASRRVAGGALLGAGIVVTQRLGVAAVGFEAPARAARIAPHIAGLTAGFVAAVALGVLGMGLAQSLVHRRATEDASVLRAVGTVLREMSSGLDGRRAICEAAQRVTGCAVAVLYEPAGGTVSSPVEPTASAGTAPDRAAAAESSRLEHVMEVWTDERARFVDDGRSGALLLEPVLRDGQAAGVLCLLFAGRTRPPSRRRRSAVRLLAAEAAVAIERAELVARLRATDRAEAAARLARDLHDSVSQEVALSSWYAQLAVKALDEDPGDARELLVQAADQLDRAQDDMRQVLRSLREGRSLDGSATLPELVDELAAEHRRRGNASVSVTKAVGDWEHLSPEVADALYFAIREALHNALKHAGASVRVALRAGARNVYAMVGDDGPGFDPARVPEGRWGLLGMRERARELGGTARVTSSPGEGTTIVVCLPRDGTARSPALAASGGGPRRSAGNTA